MEKKNKIIMGLAIGAVVLAVASGAARCSMTQPSESAPQSSDAAAEAQQQEAQTAGDSPAADPDLSLIENTEWQSGDGKSTLTVIPGVLIEKSETGESLLYYEASDIIETDSGITANLSVSKEKGGKETQAALAVTKGNGQMTLACDALATDYSMKTGESSIALAGVDENLTGLYGRESGDFAAAISKWASAKSPYATKATWTKEVWINYDSGSKVTTFVLDDAARSVVSVTLSANGELVAS